MPTKLTPDQDALAVSVIRGLAMDAPLAAKSGHQGTAMALAPLAHVLYSRVMKHSPQDPHWINRDRFILSGGHASILQYALLFLSGYGLEMNDIKQFRQWQSATPGHPEVGHTAGVEVTTGPLGQGFANGVGMAIAEAHLRARFGSTLQEHTTYVVAGDGCLMEGVSHEAASLAGHLQLDHLVCIFDDNKITIDGSTSLSCSDDVSMRFRSYGWHVIEAGDIANDLDALEKVLVSARDHRGAPTLIVLRTHIGYPSPDHTDNHEAHGNPFNASHVTSTKNLMGIPDEPFWASPDLVESYRAHCAARGQEHITDWHHASTQQQRDVFERAYSLEPADNWKSLLPQFDSDSKLATRQAFQKVLEAAVESIPTILSGAADLTGNTGTKIGGASAFSATQPEGTQVYYGIREHAMGSALVGMAMHGGVLPVAGTFFVFADYMRPAIRLAALSQAKCIFVFSHDSVGVGEDGPTHQPIEHLATLRAIPGLQVIRPADQNETREAWVAAVEHNGPTAIILSRQNVPSITDGSAVMRGAGIVHAVDSPTVVLVATGSEVSVALESSRVLAQQNIHAQVVSLPSWDRLEQQPQAFQDSLFPVGVPVVSIEAASTFGWSRWATASVGINRFGASAPGSEALDKLGINVTNLVNTVNSVLARGK